ncbi:uncharacterized protein [Linepithema humile]|uniref:uncharacterized protein n=1 Tax=Linepithema humile TaxID=83485 RepID=UPI00351F7D1F
MWNLDTYKLTHPELLSEHQLRLILENSCIDFSNFENLGKTKLLEMYKRVAMPLPQRQRGNVKDVDMDVTPEKSITDISDNDNYSLTIGSNKANNRMSQLSHPQTDKLKYPLNDQKLVHKKIQLCSTSKVETACNGISKRRCDEQNEEILAKKRQKITWP